MAVAVCGVIAWQFSVSLGEPVLHRTHGVTGNRQLGMGSDDATANPSSTAYCPLPYLFSAKIAVRIVARVVIVTGDLA